jgi:ABC-type uncharacterized transport system ATPase subunit
VNPAPSAPPEAPPALELVEITKRFPGVVACDRVSLGVAPGTVHALLGENGAGKSTAMSVASGLYAPDAGEVRIGGVRLGRGGPRTALRLGLGMVHQHFMLVPTLTVADNVVLGREPRRGPFLDRGAAAARVAATATRFGFDLDPLARVGDLSVGEQQRVEIVKVLDGGARTLVLDEPTAVLTPHEVDRLFGILRGLAADGRAIVLITHRLAEVRALASWVTVMRAGRVVDSAPVADRSEAELAAQIVGRQLRPPPRRTQIEPGERVLELDDVATAGERAALHGVTLVVRQREVLGIAGVEGNGQRALAHAVLGLEPIVRGQVRLAGRDLAGLDCARRRAAGIGWVPEDRLGEALVADMRLEENIVLGRQRDRALGRGGWLDPERVRARARELLTASDVRPPDPTLPAAALSGGNQQKLVLARELADRPQLLVLGQPTRGVDIGGIEFLHARILAARDAGQAVLLVSADLNEVLALSDRIAVLYAGRIVGEVEAERAEARQLGMWMTGATARPA